MAFSRTHAFVSGLADGDDATLLQPSDWNADHAVSGATVGGILYCPTATTETTNAGLTFITSPDCRLTVGHNTASARLYLNGAANDSIMVWQIAGSTSLTMTLERPASVNYLSFGDGVSNAFASISTQGFTSYSSGVVGWAASTNAAAVNDTGFSRTAAGAVALGNGTAGSYAGNLKLSNLITTGAAASAGAGTVAFGGTTQTTIGANGGASALTALPLGYITVNVAGTAAIIPYYNA